MRDDGGELAKAGSQIRGVHAVGDPQVPLCADRPGLLGVGCAVQGGPTLAKEGVSSCQLLGSFGACGFWRHQQDRVPWYGVEQGFGTSLELCSRI